MIIDLPNKGPTKFNLEEYCFENNIDIAEMIKITTKQEWHDFLEKTLDKDGNGIVKRDITIEMKRRTILDLSTIKTIIFTKSFIVSNVTLNFDLHPYAMWVILGYYYFGGHKSDDSFLMKNFPNCTKQKKTFSDNPITSFFTKMTKEQIKQLRLKLGLSITGFAKKLNYSRGHISDVEGGRVNIGVKLIKAINELEEQYENIQI